MKTESILLLHVRKTPRPQRQTSPQSKGLGKDFPSNGPKKQAAIAILISNEIDFQQNQSKETRRTFHVSHRKNSSIGNLNTEHVCPEYKDIIICKRKTTKA